MADINEMKQQAKADKYGRIPPPPTPAFRADTIGELIQVLSKLPSEAVWTGWDDGNLYVSSQDDKGDLAIICGLATA
jgi:hypothetical protein